MPTRTQVDTSATPDPVAAVRIDDLSVQFDVVRAVDGISFQVKRG